LQNCKAATFLALSYYKILGWIYTNTTKSGKIKKIWLTSHDAGNKVTDKDRQLADKIDEINKEIA
jgi:hypothetical protein